jgi:hypothetical protein
VNELDIRKVIDVRGPIHVQVINLSTLVQGLGNCGQTLSSQERSDYFLPCFVHLVVPHQFVRNRDEDKGVVDCTGNNGGRCERADLRINAILGGLDVNSMDGKGDDKGSPHNRKPKQSKKSLHNWSVVEDGLHTKKEQERCRRHSNDVANCQRYLKGLTIGNTSDYRGVVGSLVWCTGTRSHLTLEQGTCYNVRKSRDSNTNRSETDQ